MARFRSTSSYTRQRVATQVLNNTSLPEVLSEMIASLATGPKFLVRIHEFTYKKYVACSLVVILPGFLFNCSLYPDACTSPRRLPFFATVGDVAREDRDNLKFFADPQHDKIMYFFRTLTSLDDQTHDHLSYFSDRACTQELANDVMLCDLPAVDDEGGRHLFRRLQHPFVTGDLTDPWCCGDRSGGFPHKRS